VKLVVAIAAAMCGCYGSHDVPLLENPHPTLCTVVGVEIDVDSGVRDDAGVTHYRTRPISESCP